MTAYLDIVYDLSDEPLRATLCDQLTELKQTIEFYTHSQRGSVTIVTNPVESWEKGLCCLPADVVLIVDVLRQVDDKHLATNLCLAIRALPGFEKYSIHLLVRPSISQFHFTPK